ncbi:hypothetical protein Avbf_01167 [Armadillidium vulgare]|nr:hypothetical protein Avbf_01167 [Armadillidium vulgare]
MSTKYCHPPIDASKMLEAALQQMDGIIAGAQLELASLPDRSISPSVSIASLCEKLKSTIQYNLDDNEIEEVDDETRQFLLRFLSDGRSKVSNNYAYNISEKEYGKIEL